MLRMASTLRQYVTQCQLDSKAHSEHQQLPFRSTTITLKTKSTLLTVHLKPGKIVKLTEVGRLFHALMH